MVAGPSCRGINKDGAPCRAPRLRDGEFCFWHSPEHAAEAADARRLGGLRRRREATIQGAYELDGLDVVQQARRWIEIAAADAPTRGPEMMPIDDPIPQPEQTQLEIATPTESAQIDADEADEIAYEAPGPPSPAIL